MPVTPKPAHRIWRVTDRSRPTVWATGLTVALFALTLPACQRTPSETAAAPSTQPVPTFSVDLSTPEGAVRTVLSCLQAELRAIAAGDKAADQYYADMLPSLAAKETILRGLRGQMRVYKLTEDEALKRFTANWGAVVSYYSEGFQLDQLKPTAAADKATEAYVFVPARGPDDNALLRIRCVHEADERWRVAGIDFQPQPVVRTASQPASRRAP